MSLGVTGPQVGSNKYISIIKSRFDNNSAGGFGGAIFINPSTDGLHSKIYNTEFSKNNAKGEGGSVSIFNSNGKHSQLNGSNFMLIESSLSCRTLLLDLVVQSLSLVVLKVKMLHSKTYCFPAIMPVTEVGHFS